MSNSLHNVEVRIEEELNIDDTPCLNVNDRYLIYLDDGVVYDSVAGEFIPEYVFTIRDIVMVTKQVIEEYLS